MVRRTKQEMLEEFDRIFNIYELIQEFIRSQSSPIQLQLLTRKPTRDQMLAQVGTNGISLSALILGVRSAISEHSDDLRECIEDGDEFASDFFKFYREKTGRNYFHDAGNPTKIARQILKRGQIRNEIEFRLITDVLNDVEQAVFNPDEISLVNSMMERFEAHSGEA